MSKPLELRKSGLSSAVASPRLSNLPLTALTATLKEAGHLPVVATRRSEPNNRQAVLSQMTSRVLSRERAASNHSRERALAKAQSTASLHSRPKPLSIAASEAGYRTATLAPSILLNTVQTPSSHQNSQKKLRPFAERSSEASIGNRALRRQSVRQSFLKPSTTKPLVLRRKSGQTQMQ